MMGTFTGNCWQETLVTPVISSKATLLMVDFTHIPYYILVALDHVFVRLISSNSPSSGTPPKRKKIDVASGHGEKLEV